MRCKGTAYYGGLCKSCFCRLIERRVRKHMRLSKAFDKNDIILVNEPICRYFVDAAVQSMPVKIVQSGKHTKNVLLWTIEDEIEEFLEYFLKNSSLKEGDKKTVKIFKTLRESELEAFAKAKKIEFRKKDSTIRKLLQKMEKKHPETKFSLLKSADQIKKILRK